MFGNYSPANLNRQSSAGKNKAGKYPDRHFTTGKHKTGKAKTGNRIFPSSNTTAEAAGGVGAKIQTRPTRST